MKNRIYNINKEVKVIHGEDTVNLTTENEERIKAYWDSLDKEGKDLFNGELYVVDEIFDTESELQFHMKKSDFAHFMYSSRAEMGIIDKHEGDKTSRNIYTCVHILTKDGYIIVGEMDESTASPNMICYIGGALDKSCKKLDGTIDLKLNIEKELSEEIGLFMKSGFIDSLELERISSNWNGSRFAMVFRAELNIDRDQLADIFKKNNEEQVNQGKRPELKRIIAIENNKNAIKEFLDYHNNKNKDMEAVLESIQNEGIACEKFDIR